jgi:hypothetical protein
MVRFVGAEKGQVRAMVVPPRGAHWAAHLIHKSAEVVKQTISESPEGFFADDSAICALTTLRN